MKLIAIAFVKSITYIYGGMEGRTSAWPPILRERKLKRDNDVVSCWISKTRGKCHFNIYLPTLHLIGYS